MDEKISLEAIALYSDAYAEKVLKKFFDGKSRISGQEILSLCDVQQINLFVVRELFKAWKEETKKLKSAYFDFEHPEVKEALESFMSLLSKHISVERPHFAPLLKKAISQTLLMIFDPYDYYSMLITGKNNKLEIATFQEELKYIRVNKAPLDQLLLKLKEKNSSEIQGNEAFALLDQILEEVNFTPEDVESYVDKFSIVHKLSIEQFYIPKVQEKQQVVSTPKTTTPPPSNQSGQKSQSTVNEVAAPSAKVTLADNFQKIDKIKEKLTINQKFMFTKVLFGGDFEIFSKTVDDLDRQKDLPSALRYLEEHYAEWDKESEEFHEFMELVEKRFS
jgi:hypothetical protein